jgi:two-component system sensor histidine kinase TctE
VILVKRSPPSLRRRLMLNMLLPAAALAVALGVGGWLMIRNVVEAAHDRLLDGSVLAIAERLTVDEDNEVTVDLPPVALGMLESQAHDSIYYNVTYDGTLVTGYQDLPRPDLTRLAAGETTHWDAVYRSNPIRVAAQLSSSNAASIREKAAPRSTTSRARPGVSNACWRSCSLWRGPMRAALSRMRPRR